MSMWTAESDRDYQEEREVYCHDEMYSHDVYSHDEDDFGHEDDLGGWGCGGAK